jgi:hypothetical protein
MTSFLRRKLTFPTSKPYNEKFGSNARLLVWTEARLRARGLYKKTRAHARVCVVEYPRACAKLTEKRNSDKFLSILL